jgi:hypothetical protein
VTMLAPMGVLRNQRSLAWDSENVQTDGRSSVDTDLRRPPTLDWRWHVLHLPITPLLRCPPLARRDQLDPLHSLRDIIQTVFLLPVPGWRGGLEPPGLLDGRDTLGEGLSRTSASARRRWKRRGCGLDIGLERRRGGT